MKAVIHSNPTHSVFALILSDYSTSSSYFLVFPGFSSSLVRLHVSLWLCFAFISLGNIDISGLMDAFPAQHTSYQRRVNRGGHELIRGEGLTQSLIFSFLLPSHVFHVAIIVFNLYRWTDGDFSKLFRVE